MNLLDVTLIAAALSFAVSGYRQGFIVGVLSFAGFIGGGALAMVLLPRLVEPGATTAGRALLTVGVVLLCALAGQYAAALAGASLRRFLTWHPARLLDAGAGALVSVAAMLVVAWAVGSALASTALPPVARAVRGSMVLRSVEAVVPAPASGLFTSFERLLDTSGFPDVFAGIAPERIVDTPPPDEATARSAGVREARPSIVKILGIAEACDRSVEGSGFVYARERVITNAHVVASVRRPRVVAGERSYTGRVVAYDPDRDLAVLAVPGLDAEPLSFATPAVAGAEAVVAGYPRNGPFRAVPARVRSTIVARGTDIYGREGVRREVYAVRAVVEPGNSGGPLLSPQGRVYGVVFAASFEDRETGYALTAAEAAPVAAAGRRATEAIDTQGCAA